LLNLKAAATKKTFEQRSYDEQYEWLRQQTDSRSTLEKQFLDSLFRSGRKLPDYAQKSISNYPTRPDFYYEDGYVCVYCDGTPHDELAQHTEDKKIRDALRGLGYRVIVIRYDRDLGEQIEEHCDVFGVVRK
jgi:very-short-patch-repair endonuclease